jgi:hypothetical protein
MQITGHRKKIWRRVLIVLGVLVAATVSIGLMAIWQQNAEAHRLPFLLNAEPVIANKVHSIVSTTKPSARLLRDFQLEGNEVTVTPEVSAEVRQILADTSTYHFSISKCFEPGLALSFGDGPDRVDVLICLLCNRVVFYRGDEEVARHLSDQGNLRLARIYKKLFGIDPPPF